MNNTGEFKLKVQAINKRARISPEKARRVVDQIRGYSYEEALMILEFMPYRACYPILQLLSSAAANASHNLNLSKSVLYISEILVNQGPKLKRFQPRAQGKAYPIHKSKSHIKIVLQAKN